MGLPLSLHGRDAIRFGEFDKTGAVGVLAPSVKIPRTRVELAQELAMIDELFRDHVQHPALFLHDPDDAEQAGSEQWPPRAFREPLPYH